MALSEAGLEMDEAQDTQNEAMDLRENRHIYTIIYVDLQESGVHDIDRASTNTKRYQCNKCHSSVLLPNGYFKDISFS